MHRGIFRIINNGFWMFPFSNLLNWDKILKKLNINNDDMLRFIA